MKRFVDAVFALVALLLLSPLLVVIAAAVRVTSGPGIIYSQSRIGRGGREFRFYKFRSMHRNADRLLEALLNSDPDAREEWERFQKLRVDPRITPLGDFLRRTSLDELPQLINILIGDMSFVGPRPCMLSQVKLYGADWQYYCAVRPGLTGLWQVSGRSELTYADRVRLDRQYVANWSIALDVRILLRTFVVVLQQSGSR